MRSRTPATLADLLAASAQHWSPTLRALSVASLAGALALGCGTDEPSSPGADTVSTDVAAGDGEAADTGEADTGNADTGNADTGNTDAGNADAGNADAAADAGVTDGGSASSDAATDDTTGDDTTSDDTTSDSDVSDATTADASDPDSSGDASASDSGGGDATSADASSSDAAGSDASGADTATPLPEACSATKACSAGKACQIDACGSAGVCVAKPVNCGSANDPQCGCDGVTYASGCARLVAGVGLKSKGACPAVGPQKCKTGVDSCPKGSFCVAKTCGAGVDGVCEVVKSSCAAASVCGCNGTTYDSDCKAHAAGQNVWLSGSCPSCKAGDACAGGWCPVSKCDASGTCAAKPSAVCATVAKPVCGCDGKTYTNACKANAAGMAVDYDGACTVPCKAGDSAKACAATEYCKLPVDKCADTGVCAPKPTDCKGDTGGAVCGCDGKDYATACAAAQAGAAVVKAGKCPTGKTCSVEADCDDSDPCTKDSCVAGKCDNVKDAACCVVGQSGDCTGSQYCKAATPGHCAGAGTCENKPMICAKIYKPVCGCDNKTYGNACDAAGAGQNPKSNGPCP